jgi:ABC-type sugar transport system ATPase subunit
MTVVSIPSKGSYAELKLTVYPNEVLGVTGLTGMGQDVLPYQIAGVLPGHATYVEVQGKKVKKGPIAARRAGIVCVPANRRAHAFWMDGTVRENYTIANLQHFMKRGFLRRPEERAASDSFFSEWRIAARGIESPMSTLSGGNQQKVSIARAVSSSDWRVLLVHEPTQGIDITTRAEVLSRLRALCTVDRSVVIFGADYDALAEACDRVIVLRQGSGTVELEAHDLSEEAIAFAAMKARRDEG